MENNDLMFENSLLIEIYSEPNKTTFIRYGVAIQELNAIMIEIFGDLLEHLKTQDIIKDYAISSFKGE